MRRESCVVLLKIPIFSCRSRICAFEKGKTFSSAPSLKTTCAEPCLVSRRSPSLTDMPGFAGLISAPDCRMASPSTATIFATAALVSAAAGSAAAAMAVQHKRTAIKTPAATAAGHPGMRIFLAWRVGAFIIRSPFPRSSDRRNEPLFREIARRPHKREFKVVIGILRLEL